MLRLSAYLLPILLLCACGDAASADAETDTAADAETTAPAVPTLEMAWETDTTLTTVESVYHDEARDRLYVANIEDNPWEMDGRGSIGIVTPDGAVTDARWATGLNAPKGMGMRGDTLYAADLDAVVAIDVNTGTVLARHVVPGAEGLNDIDVAADGTIYVSDSKTGRVHRGLPGNWTTVVEGMERPNGVLVTDEGVLLGDTKAKTLSRLKADGSRETLVEGVEPDGIVALAEGGYIVSRWGGEIHHISPDWVATPIFTSPNETDKTADIYYLPGRRLLMVPTFFGNRVVAYRVGG